MVELSKWRKAQEREGKLRTLAPLEHLGGGKLRLHDDELIDFSSNDYLGLSEHPALIGASQEALARYGTGAGAARLMSGNFPIHQELEAAVAALKGKEAGLLFGSGYNANTGIIASLFGRHDVVFSDRLNHASIYDGCRLSDAQMVRFHHNDCNHLEELLKVKRGTGQALIVVESIYSMDGDRCPLKEIITLKERYDCLLLVDEAHATGIFGPNGGGVIEEEGVSAAVDLAMGTFGKALGSYGAYVAASQAMIDFLINKARSFIFSTALPPNVAAASLAAVQLLQDEPNIRLELLEKVDYFKNLLLQAGASGDLGPSQIIPLIIGQNVDAVKAAETLRQAGYFVTAVRPPTVPEGSARLRFSITRHHQKTDLEQICRHISLLFAGEKP